MNERFSTLVKKDTVVPLDKLRVLFARLEALGIDYAVWKSLENLQDQLEVCAGDIDVLFLEQQKKDVFVLLWELGFVLDEQAPGRVGRDIFVFRGFDSSTMTHIMIHGHFKLRFGNKKAKEYHFPYEEALLDSAINVSGVKCLSIANFYITRFLMAILKPSNKVDRYIQNMAFEYSNLSETDKNEFEIFFSPVMGKDIHITMECVARSGVGYLSRYYDHSIKIVNVIKDDNLTKNNSHQFFSKKIMNISRNKTIPAEIVLLGHDGVGKTSISNKIKVSLRKIGTVKVVYMGRNRWVLPNRIIKYVQKVKGLRFIAKRLWPLSSFSEIFGRFLYGSISCKLGAFVVYDRGFADLLCKHGGKKNYSDRIVYNLANKLFLKHGDIRCLLVADECVASKRAGNLAPESISKRKHMIQSVVGPEYRVIDTTHSSIDCTAGKIISDLFFWAGHKQKQRMGDLL